MSKRRIYVQIPEADYRAICFLGILTARCPGNVVYDLIQKEIAAEAAVNPSFAKMHQENERAYGDDEPRPYQRKLPHLR